jgi:hypothetical protein
VVLAGAAFSGKREKKIKMKGMYLGLASDSYQANRWTEVVVSEGQMEALWVVARWLARPR